jgi:6-phosphogluconolactonase
LIHLIQRTIAVPSPAESAADELIIGTYTERLPHVDGQAEGILACRFEAGTVGPVRLLAATRNPSFVVLSADGRHLYAVNETTEFEGQPGGGVTAYARDPGSGELTLLNTRPSAGVEPAHLEVDPGGRFLLVGNYRSGSVAVFALEAGGSLGAMVDHVQHSGSSIDPVRQTGPHAHMIMFDPVTGEVLVPDLGLDAILVYSLSDEGKLTEHPDRRIGMAPGAGPRHLAFHPDRAHLFLVNELDNTVVTLRRTDEGWKATDVASTLQAGFGGHSQAAAIRVSPSGRSVLVTNRGEDSDTIALFRFHPDNDGLELVSLTPSGGREPREFIFSPDGRFVIIADQDSGTLVVMEFSEDEPGLQQISSAPVPTPVCLRIA